MQNGLVITLFPMISHYSTQQQARKKHKINH